MQHTKKIKSVLELGANIGLNLMAIKQLLPFLEMAAVEINKKAVAELKTYLPEVNVYNSSILDFIPHKKYDLVFTRGVLIHLNPDNLKNVYKLLYDSSSKYILIAEYYNPTPVSIDYRGHKNKLFKRDFAGELLDIYDDLFLLDYGFIYHRDLYFPQDDITWFLIEKIKG